MASRHLYLRQRGLRPSPFTNRHSFLHLGTATPLCSATVTRCIPEESGIAAVAAAGITAAASTRGGSSRATVVVSGVGPRLDVVVRSRLPWLGDAMRRVLLATCASCSTRLEGLGCNRTDDFSTPISSGSNMSSIARFPKLDECAHFHYEHVELSSLEVSLSEGSNDSDSYAVRVTSGDACWTLQRSYDNFVMFDKQLHRCIFDRKFSSLTKLPDTRPKNTCDILRDYLNRFSQLNHEGLNCGPVLNWLQLDNRGRRILVPESDSCPINTPAVAAAYAVRPYVAQAPDEISFQVGDMISVIDMPPPGESTWWRGKHGFAVGFFPAECVAVIGDKVPRHLTVSTTVRSKLPVKPVLRKHGKLIAFFRSFILNRPSRRRLKQSGILKERVFGCDLGEHLLNSGQDVPTVLTCCAEFIENHGLVDGIYRLSGVTSNIQRLRNAFDEDRVPALHSDESILQDIHSVASLLKMYFRELPNPLCTYQLYSTFVSAVQASTDAERLRRMRDTVRKLPPPHYRTLEYLMRHLVRVAARGAETGMTPRNVAIVWAPNLLRCKELEVGGVAALQGVGVQAVVTEFLVCYAELIFGDGPVGRPKSLAITTPARLLSLEEARNRSLRADAPNTASPLDLSEIQLNFDLEEREMRMFSEEESGGVASVEASPRRQRTEGTQNIAATGGSKRKRSRLEERLQCDVELRFIDSQSPDQVMVSADIHSMDTPSPLPTPGYLPLLSEASTPLTPATLHGTPHSTSPVPANSPRISFRSFTLPLEIDDNEQSNANKLNRTSVSSDKSSDPSHRLSVNLEGQSNAKSCERIMTYDKHIDLYDDKESSKAQKTSKETNLVVSDVVDQEMMPCERLMSHPSEIDSSKVTTSICKDIENRSSSCPVEDNKSRSGDTRDTLDVRKHDVPMNKSIVSQNDDAMAGNSNAHRNELPGLPLSSATDLDSPMSCEQTIEDLPDSGFVICDNSDKIFTNTETSQMISNTNDSGEWVIVETTGSITTPTSESSSSKDPLEGTVNNAIATDAPQLRSISENVSRTSLDLTMGSTVDTDTSCIGVSDLTESPVLPQESAEMTFDVADNRELEEHDVQRTSRVFDDQTNFGVVDSGNNFSNIVHSPVQDQDNGNQKIRTVSMADIHLNQKSNEMEHENNACYTQLDNTKAFNRNENSVKEQILVEEETFGNSQRSSKSLDFQQQEIRRSLQLHKKPQFQASDRCSFPNQSKKSQNLDLSLTNADNNKQRCQNQKSEKCQSFEYVSPKESNQNSQQHKQFSSRAEESLKCNNVKNSQLQEHIEVVIPSENAAEPSEIAHPPEGASETTSLNSSCTFSNASSPVDDSIVLRDTAAILQELALQRLSGGIVGDLSVPSRRRYEAESNKDRRSFDSEIGREIVRERKMKQELDSARGKSEEPPVNNTQHLPPCLRARHARATRASLSRSLDEAKFNKMTEEASLPVKQVTEDAQHSSTPNVGTGSNATSSSSDKTHLKNLGLDLGDPQCRERIEKYKEERRTFLRDKYRSESFRGMLSKTEDDGEQALLARLKQRASRPSLH
ncbi:uncharacterized protein LOC107998917 isoform X5 [Apis cerana]|uniref:uncharacterized protein LOC107998917 isoform X5 n=1 Tax=Apis cerana TaxID=7461 RepID=UPI002B224A22|nr:uncharacterized protein LOC107998917 isoform X5 [Apis cerana]